MDLDDPGPAYWEVEEDRVATQVAEELFCWQYGGYWEYQDWGTQAAYIRIALDAMATVTELEESRLDG